MMRIATSTIYQQQTAAMDLLQAQEALYGQQLSSGKQVEVPSDDPMQIAEDLSVRSDIGVQTQLESNFSNVSQQLTTVDGALGSLTNVLQSARSLAVQAASDTNTSTQLQEIGIQVGQLLQEAIGLANTQYAGTYVFAGTTNPSSVPVTANGSAATVVNFTGNNVAQTQVLPNGQTVTSSVTLQQAFNYDAADGSPSVFQVLENLYNTLNTSNVADTSSVQVNAVGTAITAGTTLAQLVGPNSLAATPLTLDNGVPPEVSIVISSAASPNGTTITLPPTDTMTQVVAAINGASVATGVTASFDTQTDKLTLSGDGPFQVSDTPTPGTGATTSGNFVEAFNLSGQADVVNDLSAQLGDIDNVTQVMLSARAQVGATIQQVNALSSGSSAQVNTDTTTQSGIEDTDVAKATTEFSLTQTALQAAYSTTSQLEQKDLFDYLTTSS
ncbi:MAG TPA: flagellar hook-associated protein FlgL [Candidatus Acidoferrales bacterium]|nr:flagellar hook-associated protein FlgL [Candidatus Acidoferrales bacterium]